MRIIGVIPARMASSRFPNKPMAIIRGMPMIGHVYYRCKMNKTLENVYVATCDDIIQKYVESIGGNVVMTSNKHERATDRCADAMSQIEMCEGKKTDILVMVQGDEPMIYPEMIDEAVAPLLNNQDVMVSNLMAPLQDQKEHEDPNEVKVVVDNNGDAIYFSRAPIPSRAKCSTKFYAFKQVCVIPFRRDFLLKFNSLSPTPLEIIESIDMLRVLEHGYKIKIVSTKFLTYSVDTPGDLSRVEVLMEKDVLLPKYLRLY